MITGQTKGKLEEKQTSVLHCLSVRLNKLGLHLWIQVLLDVMSTYLQTSLTSHQIWNHIPAPGQSPYCSDPLYSNPTSLSIKFQLLEPFEHA